MIVTLIVIVTLIAIATLSAIVTLIGSAAGAGLLRNEVSTLLLLGKGLP